MAGKFITIEGGEGAGKSTQVKKLVSWLAQQGIDAVATREVGGCPTAEEIRSLWLSQPKGALDILTEAMLVMAARREHLVHTVWPTMEKGVWVVSDRFVDSTRAYQGVAQGLGLDKVDVLYKEIAADFLPDLTLLLDTPVDVGLARMDARSGKQDRFEQQNIEFHEKLRAAFLSFAEADPKRFSVIDASLDVDAVSASMIQAVTQKLMAV